MFLFLHLLNKNHWVRQFFCGLVISYGFFVVFEPDEDEKNEKEYKKIHDDYKNLVSKYLFI